MDGKESRIILNWMTLNNERERETSLRPGLVRQNCSWGSCCFDIRSVNMQFDINLDTSLTAGRG